MRGTSNNSKKVSKVTARQKTLLPTLKEQQRYVVYNVLARENMTNFESVHNSILSQCSGILGVFDGSKAGLIGVKYDSVKMRGVIRVNSKYVDKLKVCLGMIREINKENVTVDCIYVSGVLHKAVDKMDS